VALSPSGAVAAMAMAAFSQAWDDVAAISAGRAS